MSTATRTVSSICRRGDHVQCATAKARCECSCHPVPKAEKPKRVVRSIGARRTRPSPRPRVVVPVEPVREFIRKEDRTCGCSKRDAIGRLCIGWCREPGCQGVRS